MKDFTTLRTDSGRTSGRTFIEGLNQYEITILDNFRQNTIYLLVASL